MTFLRDITVTKKIIIEWKTDFMETKTMCNLKQEGFYIQLHDYFESQSVTLVWTFIRNVSITSFLLQ